ncbi:MAG TPA: hypothetical protein IAC48_02070 [Candidatus Limiplasma stercoravium]|nr:hypothetical protein [Candidatus Limiplasma stercoravium]
MRKTKDFPWKMRGKHAQKAGLNRPSAAKPCRVWSKPLEEISWITFFLVEKMWKALRNVEFPSYFDVSGGNRGREMAHILC